MNEVKDTMGEGQSTKRPGRPPSKVKKKRATFYIPEELIRKTTDYVYWNPDTSASGVITRSLMEFFKDKNVKPAPK